jgi:hypothetical protein
LVFLLRVRGKHFDLWQPPSDERESKPQAGLATLNVPAEAKSENEAFPSARIIGD